MSSRDAILGRIRSAQTLAPPVPVEVPRDYRLGRTLPDAERRELLGCVHQDGVRAGSDPMTGVS